jgi:hypothetical protein
MGIDKWRETRYKSSVTLAFVPIGHIALMERVSPDHELMTFTTIFLEVVCQTAFAGPFAHRGRIRRSQFGHA